MTDFDPTQNLIRNDLLTIGQLLQMCRAEHGWEVWNGREWVDATDAHQWADEDTYRAKPAPAPKLFITVNGVTNVVAGSADQWDETLRGKKMSSADGRVIFKYQMPVLERFTMKLPNGAEIIRMADQGGMFWLWAVVDTRLPDEDRHFVAVKCGANVPEIPSLLYRGFCAVHVQQELGLYIFEDLTHAD